MCTELGKSVLVMKCSVKQRKRKKSGSEGLIQPLGECLAQYDSVIWNLIQCFVILSDVCSNFFQI